MTYAEKYANTARLVRDCNRDQLRALVVSVHEPEGLYNRPDLRSIVVAEAERRGWVITDASDGRAR